MAMREAEYGRRARGLQAMVPIFIYQQAMATSTLAVSTCFFSIASGNTTHSLTLRSPSHPKSYSNSIKLRYVRAQDEPRLNGGRLFRTRNGSA